MGLLAHGIGGVRDLPVPLSYFFFGAGIVLVISFVALGALWKRPVLEERSAGRPLPAGIQRVLLSPVLHAILGGIAFALLVIVWVAALFGTKLPDRNLAPTFVYVHFWLWMAAAVVLFGNVWRVLNPWRAAAAAAAALRGYFGFGAGRPLPYPARLGRWPAAVLLLAFAAIELAWVEPANPRHLGIAITVYSFVTWVGMATFGRDTWAENGEAFTVYFGFLSRLAPFAVHERQGQREVVARLPFTGLGEKDEGPGTVPFVAVMLGSVAFDGFGRTTFWQDRYYSVQVDHLDSPGLADLLGFLMSLGGLIGMVVLVALVYRITTEAARWMVNGRESLTGTFAPSLIPIALAYVVAHYFSLALLQGQGIAPLASDPLGKGWDLFGSADVRPNLTFLSPNVTWYVQVAALVVGHAAGLMVAHDRAVGMFDRKTALWTQYPMLALMVTYTVGGLWLLSQG